MTDGVYGETDQGQSDGVRIQNFVTRQTRDAPHSAHYQEKTLCWDQCGEFFLLRAVWESERE